MPDIVLRKRMAKMKKKWSLTSRSYCFFRRKRYLDICMIFDQTNIASLAIILIYNQEFKDFKIKP